MNTGELFELYEQGNSLRIMSKITGMSTSRIRREMIQVDRNRYEQRAVLNTLQNRNDFILSHTYASGEGRDRAVKQNLEISGLNVERIARAIQNTDDFDLSTEEGRLAFNRATNAQEMTDRQNRTFINNLQNVWGELIREELESAGKFNLENYNKVFEEVALVGQIYGNHAYAEITAKIDATIERLE